MKATYSFFSCFHPDLQDPAYHINIDQLGVDLTSLSSAADQSLSSSVSSSAYPAAQGGRYSKDFHCENPDSLLQE